MVCTVSSVSNPDVAGNPSVGKKCSFDTDDIIADTTVKYQTYETAAVDSMSPEPPLPASQPVNCTLPGWWEKIQQSSTNTMAPRADTMRDLSPTVSSIR